MRRQFAWVVGLAGLLAVGCAEGREPLPAAPLAAVSGGEVGVCGFISLSGFMQSYFRNNGAYRELGGVLINQMKAAGAGSTVARDKGFDLLVLVANTVTAGNGGPLADGNAVVNGTIACMFADAADRPITFPEDFTAALDPGVHGAFAVRGGTNDPASDPVYARPGLPLTFSGVAPQSGETWPATLSGNPAPSRLLLYGRPGSDPSSYDWKVVPRSATFVPPVIVGLCIDPNAATTSMLQEEHVGFLSFADAYFLNELTCSPVAFTRWNPLRFASSLLGVRPLWAATVVNPGGLGGSTGGIGSLFSSHDLQASSGGTGGVVLTFTLEPTDGRADQTLTAVRVTATSGGTPVGGVQISLAAVTNNGTPVILSGTSTLITPNSGVVTFTDLSINKPGGYHYLATGGVVGRPAITVTGDASIRFNVRPPK